MELKANQTFFHGTYSNLTSYVFVSKKLSVTLKSKLLYFMTKVNPNNGNETKSEVFSWDMLKSNIIFHWLQNTNL